MRTLLKVWSVLVVLSFALMLMNVQPVLADAGGPNLFHITLTCGGVTYDVVSPSASAIAQVQTSNSVSVASLIIVTVGTDTFTTYFGPGHGKAVGIQDAVQICTGTDGPATLTIYQFMTPRK